LYAGSSTNNARGFGKIDAGCIGGKYFNYFSVVAREDFWDI